VRRAAGALALLFVVDAAPAEGHGDTPRVEAITFPSALEGRPLLLSDTQGLFAAFDDGFRWLCEDAIAPNASLSAVVFGPEAGRLVFAADVGVFVSVDGGCSFRAATGLPPAPVIYGLWPHPARPAERLTAVAQVGTAITTAVYLSQDAGDTFTATGALFPGLLRTILRAEHDAEVVFALGDEGFSRSTDGGRTFEPVPATVDGMPLVPVGLDLLGARAGTSELWAVSQHAGGSRLVVSADLGATWTVAAVVEEFVESLAFDADGRRGLVATISGQMMRTEDGGATFGPLENSPGPGFGCLVRGPDGDLYACADPLQGAPFALARSPDFGLTFETVLSTLNAVALRWDCPDDAPGATACSGLCPGLPIGATCSLCPAGRPCGDASDAGETAPDTGTPGVTDAFGTPRTDAEGDHARAPDAAITPPSTSGTGGAGCTAAGGRCAGGMPWLAFVGLAGAHLARQRRQGAAGASPRASTNRSARQT
jgi:hypothetical protein